MVFLSDIAASYPLPPLALLLAALLLDACCGEARGPIARLPHPVRIIGAIIDFLDRSLNIDDLPSRQRRIRGVLTVIIVCGLVFAAGWLIALISAEVPLGWILEIIVITSLLAQRSLYRHVDAVGRALSDEGLDAGRVAVAHIVGRNVNQLDSYGVARAAIESCAENFSDAVVGPCFWYVLFGLPGLLVYKAVNTLDSMIGYRTPHYLAFGMAAARFDDLLNLLPARLSGLMIVGAASLLSDGDGSAAQRAMRRDAGKHRSPNAGWPEAAMAGALHLALAGPRRYPNLTVDDPWIGAGTPLAEASDIRRALRLYVGACAINGTLIAAVAVAAVAIRALLA